MQMSFDSLTKKKFVLDKPVRLIELFSGIGAVSKALSRLGVNFTHHIACDFDKFAMQSYNAIHGTDFSPSDITALTGSDLAITDTNKYIYILSYTFPCQDLSLAGKRQGMTKGDNTRSGLLWEVERLINELEELPQVLLMENVPQIHGTGNIESFREWIAFLERKGYTSTYKDLNAKDFGVPQNRNRTFMISLLDGYYEFPEPMPLTETLSDRLESEVDEKHYLSDTAVQSLLKNSKNHGFVPQELSGGGGYHPR